MIKAKRQEELSISYLHAVCSVQGISMEIQRHDDDGIDVMLHQEKSIDRQDVPKYRVQISVQLKSTSSNFTESDTFLSYPLKKKNYDDLRAPASTKAFLFLFIMPKDEKHWVSHSIDELLIRKCMYWVDLNDLPDSKNKNTVSVQIPKVQIVSPDLLDELLTQVAEEEL